jgi:hypothetical protein
MTWGFAPRLAANCALKWALGESDLAAELAYRPSDRRSTGARNILVLDTVQIVRSAVAQRGARNRRPARSDLAKHAANLRTNLSQVGSGLLADGFSHRWPRLCCYEFNA